MLHPVRTRLVASALIFSMLTGLAGAEVVVVVADQNPISRLSQRQLADIFLGSMTRFPEGQRAVPIDQAETSPAYAAFYLRYLDRSTAQIKAHWSKLIFTGRGRPPPRVGDSAAMARAVAASHHAIGYLDMKFLTGDLRVVTIE